MLDTESVRADVLAAIAGAADLDTLERIRIAELGKKGRITGLMKELGLDGSSLNSLVKGPAEQTAGLVVEEKAETAPKDEASAKPEKKALPANGKPKGESESKPADA